MSRQTMEWLKQALKMLDLTEIRRFQRLVMLMSKQVPNTCRCEIAKYCQCEVCEAHRNKIPLNLTWANRGKTLDDWLERCDCKACLEHRKKEDIKCYPCTKQEELSNWIDQFDSALRDVRINLIACYNRTSKRLKNWQDSKKTNNFYSNQSQTQQPQFRPSRHLSPNYEEEEEGLDPSSLYD